jgi:Rps23 Pro-64 3,4-dihydroxylase Tpa1-like proline 4-hydroxylase
MSIYKDETAVTESIPAFYFATADLERIADQYSEEFKNSRPFPHIVIDDFLPKEIMSLLIAEFPGPDDIEWRIAGPGATKQTRNKYIEKIWTSDETKFGPFTRHLMQQMNSGAFLAFIERLTGEKGIIPDPSFKSCGLHSTGPGGRLMIHIDTNRHALGPRFHQRYNLILFLNNDWPEEYGGHLELWNKDVTQCEKRILPIANRMVLFDTGTRSFHGHPQPLTCHKDRRRNSLALYYYVLDRPVAEDYQGLQTTVGWVAQTAEDKQYRFEKRVKETTKKLIPPLFLDLVRSVRDKSRKRK